jgi:hypothetical protein
VKCRECIERDGYTLVCPKHEDGEYDHDAAMTSLQHADTDTLGRVIAKLEAQEISGHD